MRGSHAKFRKWVGNALLMLITGVSGVSTADVLNVVSTEFPPYSYQQDGKVTGLAVEVVVAMLAHAGVQHKPVQLWPWARAYETALHQPNTLVFSIAQSPERMTSFHWVGEIAPYEIYLYKLKARDTIRVNSLDEAKKYLVGGEIKDIKQQYLVKQGFVEGKNLILAADDRINLRKLFASRIDLLPFNRFSIALVAAQEQLDASALQRLIKLDEISYSLFVAANLDTPMSVVEKLQDAIRTLQHDGTIERIQWRYLNE